MAGPGVIVLDDPPAGVIYTQQKGLRERAKLYLGSRTWQLCIIALVIADACLVATDIILANIYCSDDHPPHDVEVAENWLRYGSICILSFFVLEWMFEAFVHGFRRWVRTPLHLVDLLIVTISLALEITAVALGETAVEVGGLLVIFRLWRVVRVMHAVGEVEHKAHEDLHTNLAMANMELEQLSKAHHAIIKQLHHEYTGRMKTMLERQNASNRTGDQAPSLDDMLTAVSRHSAHLRHSVTLHRQSLRHLPSGDLQPRAINGDIKGSGV